MSVLRSFYSFAHVLYRYFAILTIAFLFFSDIASAQTIVMASTTSTEQSGLFGHLLPAFKKASGIDVKVVALGTGQALDMGRRGDADLLFVHDQAAEEKFVADGFSVKRLATRVIYLEQGRVLADLPTIDFFEGPKLQTHYPEAHLFVKGEVA